MSLTRKRLVGSLHKNHEDHIAGKRNEFIESLQSCAQIYSYASRYENTRCKSCSWERMGNTREMTGMAVGESQKQKMRWSLKQGMRAEPYTYASSVDLCSLKNWELEPQFQQIQRSSRTPRWHCDRWFWILCSIHWAGIIGITNDGCNSDAYHIKITRMRRTSNRRNICLYPGKNGRCTITV